MGRGAHPGLALAAPVRAGRRPTDAEPPRATGRDLCRRDPGRAGREHPASGRSPGRLPGHRGHPEPGSFGALTGRVTGVTGVLGGRRERAPEAELWRPTPLWALELPEIPTELHFIRDHFPPPDVDAESWELSIQGGRESVVVSLDQLRSLPRRTLVAVLE